jgi:hypothetical protein
MKSITIVVIVICVLVVGSAWASPMLDARLVGRGGVGIGWFNDGAINLLTSPSGNAASGIGPTAGNDIGFEGRLSYADLGAGYRFLGGLLGAYGGQQGEVPWGITLGLGRISNGSDRDAFGASGGIGFHLDPNNPHDVLAAGVRVTTLENGSSADWWDIALGYYSRRPDKFQWGASVVAVDLGENVMDRTYNAGLHGRMGMNSWLGFGVDFIDFTQEFGDMFVDFGAEYSKLFSGVQGSARAGLRDDGSGYDPSLGLGARFSQGRYGVDVAWADGPGSDTWIITFSACTSVIDNLLGW